ncbi:MAG: TetR/AcrR family transcriptional regulator [Xanthobacteraceae bacterium]|nr:TetR/AcrR family transcriptional regulator [Xanthobacteraceae bacterium]
MHNIQFLTANKVTEKGTERIRLILEEAKNTLVDEGFSGLSFRTIAKRAGITVGNVTYYFPTKDDLLVELAGYIFDRWEARFRRSLPFDLTDKMDIFLYSVRYMIEENKRVKSNRLLLEMWAMANHSTAVMRMLDTFYGKMRAWIEGMLAEIAPGQSIHKRRLRAALITSQIEGLMVLIGPNRMAHKELSGLEDEAIRQIKTLAVAD